MCVKIYSGQNVLLVTLQMKPSMTEKEGKNVAECISTIQTKTKTNLR